MNEPLAVRNFAFNFQKTIEYNGSTYLRKPKTCCQHFCFALCCGCRVKQEYMTVGNGTMTYGNPCLYLPGPCCLWSLKVDGQYWGKVKTPMCCDNGCLYFWCSCFVCKEIMFLKFYDKTNAMVNTMRLYDGCCHKMFGPMSQVWAPIISQCTDCCAFMCGKNMLLVSEKYYSGNMDEKDAVGAINQLYELIPYKGSLCCVYRDTVRNSIKAYENMADPDMLPVMAIGTMLQEGMIENKGIVCTMPLLAPATGTCCDLGRRVSFVRMTFEQALNTPGMILEDKGGAPAIEITDAVVSQPGAPSLKSFDELLAMPTKPSWFGGVEAL